MTSAKNAHGVYTDREVLAVPESRQRDQMLAWLQSLLVREPEQLGLFG